jgi:hypothetical protein
MNGAFWPPVFLPLTNCNANPTVDRS